MRISGYHLYVCGSEQIRVRVSARTGQEIKEDLPQEPLIGCTGYSIPEPEPVSPWLNGELVIPLEPKTEFNP
jgi:hypothetical protein